LQANNIFLADDDPALDTICTDDDMEMQSDAQ